MKYVVLYARICEKHENNQANHSRFNRAEHRRSDQILQDGHELFHLKRLYCWDSNPIKSIPTERETNARAESVLPMRSDRRMTDNIRCDV